MTTPPLFNGNSLRNVLVGIVLMLVGATGALFITVARHTESITALQEKTRSLPPVDYRAYVDSKFDVLNSKITDNTVLLRENTVTLNAISTDLKVHILQMR